MDEISAPVRAELGRFGGYFERALECDTWLQRKAVSHILRGRGKQLRPLLVLLSARAVRPAGALPEGALVAATLIELVHTASLVHDDVVDDSELRRGLPSLMRLLGPKRAVLVGDFLLSRGLSVAIKAGRLDLLGIMSQAVEQLSVGELRQMDRAAEADVAEADYYKVIQQKTASLIAACTRSGAVAANAADCSVEALSTYGLHLGIAFQLRDDMLDYEGGTLLGKPTLHDVAERKVTLPLIAALRMAPQKESGNLLRQLRRAPGASATAHEALRLVQSYGGLDYAGRHVRQQGELARQALQALPESPALSSLENLIDWNQDRTK